MELKYFIIYKGDNRILYQGDFKYCTKIYEAYKGMSEYALINEHQLRQLHWDF